MCFIMFYLVIFSTKLPNILFIYLLYQTAHNILHLKTIFSVFLKSTFQTMHKEIKTQKKEQKICEPHVKGYYYLQPNSNKCHQ